MYENITHNPYETKIIDRQTVNTNGKRKATDDLFTRLKNNNFLKKFNRNKQVQDLIKSALSVEKCIRILSKINPTTLQEV